MPRNVPVDKRFVTADKMKNAWTSASTHEAASVCRFFITIGPENEM